MKIRIIENHSDFLNLQDSWCELYWKMSQPSPFMAWQWVASWLECIPHAIHFYVIVVESNGQVQAILPLRKSKKKICGVANVGVLEMLQSCPQTCPDHLGVLCDPESQNEMTDLIFENLKHQSHGCMIDLKEWHQPKPKAIPYAKIWTLSLPQTFDTYVASMKADKRSKLKRLRKRFERENALSLQVLDQAKTIKQEMPGFVALHASRWGHKRPSTFGMPFSQAVHQRFLDKIDPLPNAVGCRLILLKKDGILVAGVYGFCVKKVFYYYQMARSVLPNFSGVGQLIMGHAIEASIQHGDERFDFLRGDEPFKAEWTSEFYYENRILMPGQNLMSRLYVQIQTAKARLRKVR